MEVKYQVETNRVKCVTFHPFRPWILVSFHTGEICLYDYEEETEIQRYTDHTSPVRTVAFHCQEPIFASGSDDASIKIFDYEKQRCLMTFTEHLDYIRTVHFHTEKPFLVSASDDQIIRVWNWKTRQCLTSISGHNHYVMSAFFHPTLPYILTASLDDSVRVWDVTSLFTEGQSGGIFSLTDAVIKFQQEDHSSGVNWASWHPSGMKAVSCSDDQTVKIWNVSSSDMAILATLRGHSSNVSCAVFHPLLDIVISCSEDGTVRVWDLQRYVHLTKYKRPDDRFWSVAAHPYAPYFAAGHDSGFIIFRLQKISPTYDVVGNKVYYCKRGEVREYDIAAQTDCVIGSAKLVEKNRNSPLEPLPDSIVYNSSYNVALIGFKSNILINYVDDKSRAPPTVSGHNPVIISRTHFVYLDDKPNVLYSREIQGQSITPIPLPFNCKKIFPASNGTVFLCNDDKLYHFDVNRRKVLSSAAFSQIKHVYLSPKKKHIAVLTKNIVYITNITMDETISHSEASKLKSGLWTDEIFIYSTRQHIKYLIPNGDNGIMKSTNSILYLCGFHNGKLIALSTELSFFRLDIEMRECKFKEALYHNDIPAAINLLKGAKLCSVTIFDFLESKGHPEIALQFVTEPHQKFRLAIKSGNLDVAVEAAHELNDPAIWEEIANAAMEQGRFKVAEAALIKSGNTEKLMFLYLISGQSQKFRDLKCDPSLCLQRAIFTNDRATESALLRDVAPPLAYIAQKTSDSNGVEVDEELGQRLDQYAIGDLSLTNLPECNEIEDWVLLNVSRPTIPNLQQGHVSDAEDDDDEGWGSDESGEDDGKAKGKAGQESGEDSQDSDGWDALDEEIDSDVDTNMNQSPSSYASAVPLPGTSVENQWINDCNVAGQYASSGYISDALSLLVTQIALCNPEPLRQYLLSSYISSHAAVQLIASGPVIPIPLQVQYGRKLCPLPPLSLDYLKQRIEEGRESKQHKHYEECQQIFLELLQRIPISSCATIGEEKEFLECVATCRNYIIAMDLILKSQDKELDKQDRVTYAAYYSSIPFDPSQYDSSIIYAAQVSCKLGYFKTAYDLASRIRTPGKLKNVNSKIAQMSKGSNSNPNGAEIKYSKFGNFVMCSKEYIQLSPGTKTTTCPYCGATYQEKYKGELCTVCQLCEIGKESTGLRLVNPMRRDTK